MKTLTFIGANGFIGKSFIDYFNKGLFNKYKIKKINLVSRNIKELKKIKYSKNLNFIKADISKLKNLPKSDYIIYGAENAEIKKKNRYDKIINESKESIDNFCNIVKDQKKVKILYLSSGIIKKYKNRISKAKTPIEAYVKIKKYSELKIRKLSKFRLKTSIARCYTFIGRWLPRRSKYAIGNFVENVIRKKPIIVKKNNRVIRSYMYADDMVSWIINICFNSEIKTMTCDVGSNYQIEIGQLALLFSNLFNQKIIYTKKN